MFSPLILTIGLSFLINSSIPGIGTSLYIIKIGKLKEVSLLLYLTFLSIYNLSSRLFITNLSLANKG